MSMNIHQQRGFTLIEAVVVIVITGIIAGMVSVFIRSPVQSYMDTRDRAELADTASAALRKMRVDLRLALPNSIRVVAVNEGGALPVQYLELLLTKTGARYQDIGDGLAVGTAALPGELSFTDADLTSFNYIGPPLTGSQEIRAGDSIVVYNVGVGQAPTDAYQGGNRALLTKVAGNVLTMASNPYAPPKPVDPSFIAFQSPDHRFQVVTTAVTYRCAPSPQGGEVRRYWNYRIQEAQPALAALATKDMTRPAAPVNLQLEPGNALLAGDVRGCLFDYDTPASRRSGLIGLSFSLAKAGGNVGVVTLFDQVHVDNTP
jgi:MSHA biogenesis protein MshO